MAANESALLKEFLLQSSRIGNRLWRNNVGMGWTGRTTGPVKQKTTVQLNPGDIVLRNARPFHGGFPKGSSDLIGLTPIKITAQMVGRYVAVFTAVEGKMPSGKASKEQKSFINLVSYCGGIGVIARKFEDILQAISQYNGGESIESINKQNSLCQ